LRRAGHDRLEQAKQTDHVDLPAAVRPPRDLPDLTANHADADADASALTLLAGEDYADAVVRSVRVDEDETEDVSIDRVVLRGADLSSLRFRHLRIRDVLLDTCDLSNLVLVEPSFIRVEVRDCRMTGLAFEGGQLEDVTFTGCRGEVVSFVDVQANRMAVDGCQWPEADLRSTRLSHLAVDRSELPRSQWVKAKLDTVRMTSTSLDSVKGATGLAGASIDEATFRSAALAFADALGVIVAEEPPDD
jgi:uncharacterized protein YjbI with pentapeptide repeats